ncbi:hypothetical protein D3C71_2028960 [compost metagenome]
MYKGNRDYALTYKGDFVVDGEKVATEYDRLDSPYVKAGRKPEEIRIAFEGSSLYLNFDRCERIHA